MSGPLLAEFQDPATLRSAAQVVRERGHAPLDTFSPFPLEGISEFIGSRPSRLRLAMLLGGLAIAAVFFWLQWWSSVYDYPLNVGGRPLNSWPVFLLVPFQIAMFAAALAGFVAFLWGCGLPRLHHPLFDVPGFERATQDRFFLLAQAGSQDEDGLGLRHLLEAAGALVVTQVRER